MTSLVPSQLQGGDKKVYIDGTDVSTYVAQCAVDVPAFGARTATVNFTREINGVITVTGGSICEVWFSQIGGTFYREFYGIVLEKANDLSGVQVSCADELWKASGQTVVKLYDINDQTDPFGGDIRLIMIDLAKYANLQMYDYTIDQTSVVIPQVLCDNVKCYQKMEELANAIYWDLWQNPDNRLIYLTNPSNYSNFSVDLQVGVNVSQSPQYSSNIHQVINEVEIQGVKAFPSYTQTFVGNGSSKIYQISKSPIASYVQVVVNNVVKTGAVEGSQAAGSYDYLVNMAKGIITFVTPPPAAANVQITFNVIETTNVTVSDEDSQAMTKGVRKLVLQLPDVITVEDATARGQALLSASKDMFPNFTISAFNIPRISPRYTVNFSDPVNGITYTNLAIVKISMSWPEVNTAITVGKSMFNYNNLLLSVQEQIQKLAGNRREGIQLTVNKSVDNNLYLYVDDLEIIKEKVSDGTQTTITKRRYRWTTADELSNGTYDANVNIFNGKIEFA